MARSEDFNSLAEVERELDRLDAIRRHHTDRMERHWQALLDHDVRGRLLKDAAHDMLRSWKPTRVLQSMFGGGSVGPSLGFALGRRGGWMKKAIFFTLSMALPSVLERVKGLSFQEIMDEVRTSIERVRTHLRARKEARATEEEQI